MPHQQASDDWTKDGGWPRSNELFELYPTQASAPPTPAIMAGTLWTSQMLPPEKAGHAPRERES